MSARAPQVSDATLLDWIRRRVAGETAQQIARRAGVTQERVRVVTNRVRDADLAESGEPERVVRAAYW